MNGNREIPNESGQIFSCTVVALMESKPINVPCLSLTPALSRWERETRLPHFCTTTTAYGSMAVLKPGTVVAGPSPSGRGLGRGRTRPHHRDTNQVRAVHPL